MLPARCISARSNAREASHSPGSRCPVPPKPCTSPRGHGPFGNTSFFSFFHVARSNLRPGLLACGPPGRPGDGVIFDGSSMCEGKTPACAAQLATRKLFFRKGLKNILNRDTYLRAVLAREEERPIVVYQNAGTGKTFTQYICQRQILCNICLPVPAFVCSS